MTDLDRHAEWAIAPPQKQGTELSSWLDVMDWKVSMDMDFEDPTQSEVYADLFQGDGASESTSPDEGRTSTSTSYSNEYVPTSHAKDWQDLRKYAPNKDEVLHCADLKLNVNDRTEHPAARPVSFKSRQTSKSACKVEIKECKMEPQQESATRPYEGDGAGGRIPKWKRRNPQKHLDGERSRRIKRKNMIKTLAALLPKLKGKVTTNDLLEATLKKVRDQKREQEMAFRAPTFQTVMMDSNSLACFELNRSSCVTAASRSLLEWLRWPSNLPFLGRHISAFMASDDAARFGAAIGEERKLCTVSDPLVLHSNHLLGSARFLRCAPSSAQHRHPSGMMMGPAVEIEVGVSHARTVCHFMIPSQ